jgi:hypothetical protein
MMQCFPSQIARREVGIELVAALVINIPRLGRDHLGLPVLERANPEVGARIVRIVGSVLCQSRCREESTETEDDNKPFHGHSHSTGP